MFEEGIYPPELTLLERTSMTLSDVDYLKKEDPIRFWEYYYFVVEKIKAEKKAIDKAKDKATGKSGESDTLRFKDRPDDFLSEVEEME